MTYMNVPNRFVCVTACVFFFCVKLFRMICTCMFPVNSCGWMMHVKNVVKRRVFKNVEVFQSAYL